MERIDIDDPAVDMDAEQRLLFQGEIYTGEVEEYLGGRLVSRATYVDGHQEGPAHEWYEDGRLRSQGVMRAGRAVGEFRTWHANGALASRLVRSDDGGRILAAFAWDDEGNLTRLWQADRNPAV